MKRARFYVLLTVLGFVGAAAWFCWMRMGDSRLRNEVARLQNQRSDLIRLQRDNRALTEAVSALAASPSQPRQDAPPRKSAGPEDLPAGFVRRTELRNAGTLSAEDAFQTFLWSIDHGEPEVLAMALICSDAARAQIAAGFARLPPGERDKYGNPEAMFALLYAYANRVTLTALQTAGRTAVNANQVILDTNWQFPGGQVREHPIPLYHSPAGWKVIVPDLKVEAILQQELEGAP